MFDTQVALEVNLKQKIQPSLNTSRPILGRDRLYVLFEDII